MATVAFIALSIGAAGVAIATLSSEVEANQMQVFAPASEIQFARMYELPLWARVEIENLIPGPSHHLSAAIIDIENDGRPEILVNRGLPMPDVYVPRRPLGAMVNTPMGWRFEETDAMCRYPTFGMKRGEFPTIQCGKMMLAWNDGFERDKADQAGG